MTTNSQVRDTPEAFPGLHPDDRCVECGRHESEPGMKLKRCAGCLVVVYCGKECQKRGWARHKLGCRGNDPRETGMGPDNLAGYPTPLTLNNTFTDWKELHTQAFANLATALANPHPRGVDFACAHTIIIIRAQAVRYEALPRDRNPGNTFQLLTAQLIAEEDLPPLLNQWDAGVRARIEANIRRQFPGADLFLGTMRAMLVLVDNRIMSSVYVPVSRLVDRRAVLGARDRAVFEDVVTLTIAAANAGLVVHPPGGRDRTQPEVGTLVLHGKRKWVWEAREAWDWNDIESGATPPLILKSGLRPRAIWRRFHSL